MMPDQDGLSLTRELRESIDIPILLLTARSESEDRISGFEAGADDYLPKPFEPKELLLRIHAILRRVPEQTEIDSQPKLILLGEVKYDVRKGELWQADLHIRLTGTEAQLMRIFAKSVGQPISRAELMSEMGRDQWQSQDRAIDVQITRLRRKIEANPKEPRYLQTVRGSGYMLASD
jgi:two-component system phosphate regulon response regulator OmpR